MTNPERPPPHRLNSTCNWGTPSGRCGKPARPFPAGPRCDDHRPGHHLKTDQEKQ